MRLTHAPAALIAALVLVGCGVQTGLPGRNMPERAALVATSDTSDLRTRARSFLAVVADVEPVAEAECRAQNPLRNCDFRIVVDDRPGMPPNAFQTLDAAGRPVIAFTLPLIAQVANADELAFVLAHEAAHHIAGHLERARQSAAAGAAVFGRIAGQMGGADPASIRTAEQFGAALAARSYSQEFELEADALGTVIAAMAGYDPVRGAAFFARLPDPGNRFLGTHPPNSARLAIVRETAARIGFVPTN